MVLKSKTMINKSAYIKNILLVGLATNGIGFLVMAIVHLWSTLKGGNAVESEIK